MEYLLSGLVWLLALAVSIDGFSVGLSCGLRKLRIPFPSLMVICSSSALAVAISMLAGEGVAYLIPVELLTLLGGALLVLLGLFVITQNIREARLKEIRECKAAATKRNRLTGLLRRPEDADLDKSGVLSMKEAFLLGLALAADAFAAGFAAALSGAPLIYTVFAVGLTKLLLVPLGVAGGRYLAEGFSLRYPGVISGVILLTIGICIII